MIHMVSNIKPWKNDVNVLIIFFVRDDVLTKTFESVREARPRRLLLWQDGAREGRHDDIKGIERCRKIVENIDWDCEVYKNYQTCNWGCDPSTFYSHKWAFSIVDKCIVLEDDCMPMQSFFPYCKELLDRYENDTRINRICGMNNLGHYEKCPYDYLFTQSGSVWGWATWKRVADSWEEDYAFLSKQYELTQLAKNANNKGFGKYLDVVKCHAKTGKPYWESVQSLRKLLSSSFDIVPCHNMIKSLGVSTESTHSVSNIKMVPRKLRSVFYEMPVEDISFPLNHPPYVVEDFIYPKILSGKSQITFFTKVESVIRRLIYGEFESLIKGLKKRL